MCGKNEKSRLMCCETGSGLLFLIANLLYFYETAAGNTQVHPTDAGIYLSK